MWSFSALLNWMMAATISIFSSTDLCSEVAISTEINVMINNTFTAAPMLVLHYNDEVNKNFADKPSVAAALKLDYPDDTLAYVLIFSSENYTQQAADTLLLQYYDTLKEYLTQHHCIREDQFHVIAGNKMRRTTAGILPVIHMQIAGHASGIAYYYQRSDVVDEPDHWNGKAVYGISMHPQLLQQTRFAGVFILDGIEEPGLLVKTLETVDLNIVDILNEFNADLL